MISEWMGGCCKPHSAHSCSLRAHCSIGITILLDAALSNFNCRHTVTSRGLLSRHRDVAQSGIAQFQQPSYRLVSCTASMIPRRCSTRLHSLPNRCHTVTSDSSHTVSSCACSIGITMSFSAAPINLKCRHPVTSRELLSRH